MDKKRLIDKRTVKRTRLTYKIKNETLVKVYANGQLVNSQFDLKIIFISQFFKDNKLNKKLEALSELKIEYSMTVDFPKLTDLKE